MPNSTINVSLPEPLKTYVDAQIEAGDYGTPSEYVRDLILDDRERRLHRLEAELTEAMRGEPIAIRLEELEQDNLITLLKERLKQPKG